ncbi:uncharacterized protein LOC125287881 isoform X2 [Alosa alosa]|uniref:uncharacterized protein LOC125287881 isoform X2 n=1 Tax=Alosa alosa TaxID=278164 RepID=UPI0020150715|nr:uncharacterized protein LOC125287881 isoform X2 [Alosa alosa]
MIVSFGAKKIEVECSKTNERDTGKVVLNLRENRRGHQTYHCSSYQEHYWVLRSSELTSLFTLLVILREAFGAALSRDFWCRCVLRGFRRPGSLADENTSGDAGNSTRGRLLGF